MGRKSQSRGRWRRSISIILFQHGYLASLPPSLPLFPALSLFHFSCLFSSLSSCCFFPFFATCCNPGKMLFFPNDIFTSRLQTEWECQCCLRVTLFSGLLPAHVCERTCNNRQNMSKEILSALLCGFPWKIGTHCLLLFSKGIISAVWVPKARFNIIKDNLHIWYIAENQIQLIIATCPINPAPNHAYLLPPGPGANLSPQISTVWWFSNQGLPPLHGSLFRISACVPEVNRPSEAHLLLRCSGTGR